MTTNEKRTATTLLSFDVAAHLMQGFYFAVLLLIVAGVSR